MTSPLNVKGFAWLNLLSFVEERHGVETLGRLKTALAANAEYFGAGAVTPVGWVPGDVHLAALSWLVDQKYAGSTKGAQELGRELAARNLSKTFRTFRGLEDLRVALATTERAFRQYYSEGSVRLQLDGEVLDAQVQGFPLSTPVFANVMAAGMVEFLRAGGLEAVLTSVTVGPSSMTYRVKVALPSGAHA